MKTQIKLFVASLIIILLPNLSQADCAIVVSKDAADKAVEFLTKQKEIIEYCAECGDKTAKSEAVKEVKGARVDNGAEWQVSVSGSRRDLCYIYYKTDQGHWRNLAVKLAELGVKLEDDMKENEFISENVSLYDAAGKIILNH